MTLSPALSQGRGRLQGQGRVQQRPPPRALEALPGSQSYIDEYGEELATRLRDAHRRVRQTSGDVVRGLKVRAQKPADVLGVYVYLPAGDAR